MLNPEKHSVAVLTDKISNVKVEVPPLNQNDTSPEGLRRSGNGNKPPDRPQGLTLNSNSKAKKQAINRVAYQAKRRLVTTSEPAEDCYDLLLYVFDMLLHLLDSNTASFLNIKVVLVINRVAYLAKRRLVTTSEPAEDSGGFFNALLQADDDLGGSTFSAICKRFRGWVDSCGMYEVPSSGLKYTWNRGLFFERLDQVLVNARWGASFNTLNLEHGAPIYSNHSPLIFEVRGTKWAVRNGETILFWKDVWTKHPLKELATVELPVAVLGKPVCDYVTSNRGKIGQAFNIIYLQNA
ncbi:hypothetical protein Syun_025266 [Stephania yunnanensis]|uniref:Uncharacterized protein n=1 Tax=Stephania yunnanensis TaxID=152371 RepID=A0AAP0HVN1_9MAGN